MQAYEVVQRLAATAGKLDKEQIVIDAYMADQREFFIGAKLAYDALITFGVKKVPAIDESDLNPDDPGTFSFAEFLALADLLRTRRLTGNAAAEALRDAASRCHGPTWNDFYRRVLRKDLACGATESTINKALKRMKGDTEAQALVIPVFEPQLAHDGADDKHAKKIAGVKMLDIKLDGARLLSALDKEAGTVTQYSREGRIKDEFPHIREALAKLMESLPFSVMLDGEITARTFQSLMGVFSQKGKSKGTRDTSDLKLALFDMVPLADFHAEFCPTPQCDRQAALADLDQSGLLRSVSNGSIFVLPKKTVDLATPEGRDAFVQFNKEALAAKYEGVMIKDPLAPYKCGRNSNWLKMKPFISLSMEVIRVDPGKAEGKRADVAGALVCRVVEDGKEIISGVGTGISDKQLKEFWDNREGLKGMIAEIEADAITLEKDATTYSLRFPRFKGFRGTVPGEKI